MFGDVEERWRGVSGGSYLYCRKPLQSDKRVNEAASELHARAFPLMLHVLREVS